MPDESRWNAPIGGATSGHHSGPNGVDISTLGQLQRTRSSAMRYVDAEPQLAQLLRDYGPTDRTTTPAYPFHHLQTDGLWVVTAEQGEPGSSPSRLRLSGAVGRLDPTFEEALAHDPGLIVLIARSLLDSNFPESLHHDLCEAAGLDLEALEVSAVRARVRQLRRRDPMFRALVLVAYEYRCAVCGYDGRLGAEAVGLDAAHLRWWAFDGPDTVDNGCASAPSTTSCSTAECSASRPIARWRSPRTLWAEAGPPRSSSYAWSVSRCSNRIKDRPAPLTATLDGMTSRCSVGLPASPRRRRASPRAVPVIVVVDRRQTSGKDSDSRARSPDRERGRTLNSHDPRSKVAGLP